MVRSFSYASFAGLDQFLGSDAARGADAENLAGWARAWQNSATAAFLAAYCETVGTGRELLPAPEQAQALFTAYLLEKALYELLYELNNRPTWLRIPISGILSM